VDGRRGLEGAELALERVTTARVGRSSPGNEVDACDSRRRYVVIGAGSTAGFSRLGDDLLASISFLGAGANPGVPSPLSACLDSVLVDDGMLILVSRTGEYRGA
jgi:hypothetical protein